MTTREEPHYLLDRIPEDDVLWISLLNAEVDDEPETEDERASVERARSEPHPGTPHDELLREYGL